jgi:PAS domain-containing protein
MHSPRKANTFLPCFWQVCTTVSTRSTNRLPWGLSAQPRVATVRPVIAYLPLGRIFLFALLSGADLFMTDPSPAGKKAWHFQLEWCRVTLARIGDAVITTDIEGRVTFLNPRSARLLAPIQKALFFLGFAEGGRPGQGEEHDPDLSM